MTKVRLNGLLYDYDVVVHYMDDEIREELYEQFGGECTEQEFTDAYAKAHEEKFGEKYVVN